MVKQSVRYLLSLLVMVWACSPALADHMTGTYTGVGDAQGVTLQLRQSGRALDGQFTGDAQGTLSGESDGQHKATGTVELAGAGRFQFESQWSEQGFALTLIGSQGRAQFTFVSGGAPTPPPAPQPPTPPGPTPPPPPASDVQYFLIDNGATAGPFTLEQVKARLADGRSKPGDLIWKAGMAQWAAIETLPEFAASPPPAPPAPPAPKPPAPTPPAPPAGGNPPLLSPGFPGRNSG